MPRVCLTAAQREAAGVSARQREFNRIINDRQNDGLSHKEIAFEMGVPPTTISNWKKSVEGMTIRNLRKLIQAAGLTDDEVLRIIR